jgi:hypothetical protein
MKRNNRMSDSDQAAPMPDRYSGGSNEFGVTRMLDGHNPYGPSLDNNVHSPTCNSGSRGVDYGDLLD